MLQINAFIFNPFGENTFVLYDETNECVIIDPGCDTPSEEDSLFGFIDSHHLKPLMILNTHGHVDHVIGNWAVKQRYGIHAAAHDDTKKDFIRAKRLAPFYGMTWKGGEELPEVWLEDDQIINVGNSMLEVICTPGHAMGGVSFYAPMEGWVFTGDALFCRSVGRADMPGGNMELLIESIRTRLFTLPDDTTVFSGHGEMTTIGEEFNPDLHEAVTQIPASGDMKKNQVFDEVLKGYYINDKVLRHAKVVVAI